MSVWGSFKPAPGWTIHAAASAKGLCRLSMADTAGRFLGELCEVFPGIEWRRDDRDPLIAEAARQLTEYFEGTRTAFDLPLDLRGTPFQLKVWQALRRIPHGETRSYADVARAIRAPQAMRAVGGANGRNPVGIVVPCHRVIAASGGLGGFSCGLEYKKKLLALESRAAGA